jgi:hypothetical protein
MLIGQVPCVLASFPVPILIHPHLPHHSHASSWLLELFSQHPDPGLLAHEPQVRTPKLCMQEHKNLLPMGVRKTR